MTDALLLIVSWLVYWLLLPLTLFVILLIGYRLWRKDLYWWETGLLVLFSYAATLLLV